MTPQANNLSIQQKELVAVGASVGTGCRPCATHHLKAGAKTGLDREQLLAAVTSAERVSAEATVALGDHVRGKLGPGVSSPALLSRLEQALASLGAALGAKDATSIERQLRIAAELGATRSQLQEAIETAHTVAENAARIHLREAEHRLDAVAPAATVEPETESPAGCGCDSSDQDEAVPAETPEPAAAASGTSGTSGGCSGDEEREPASNLAPAPVTARGGAACRHSMPGSLGPSDAFGAAPPGCRRMFERFGGGVPPVEPHETPAAAATGCKKEA